MKSIRALVAAMLIAGATFIGLGSGQTAQAGGYYRGYGCVNGRCGSVHAYSYRTPTFGHMHHYPWGCTVVKINKDFGSYVSISYAGRC